MKEPTEKELFELAEGMCQVGSTDDVVDLMRENVLLKRQLARMIEGSERLAVAFKEGVPMNHQIEFLRGTVEAIRNPDLLPKPGDYVWVDRIQESWVVASAEAGRDLICCGWPCASIPVAECELEYVCPEEESKTLVLELSKMREDHGGSDPRAIAVRRLYPAWLEKEGG